MTFEFKGKLWRWQGDAPAAWHFITLPDDVAGQIKFITGQRKGFGSVRVGVRIGDTRWKTSLFPDSKTGSYFLPVKAEVRKTERVADGDWVQVKVSVDA